MFTEHHEYEAYYQQQEALQQRVILSDQLSDPVRYIAGADVDYDDAGNRMAGAVVVLDHQTGQIVDRAYHIMEITFPYVPGLFSFREIPPLVFAFEKLSIQPDVIICDGHGVAHPKKLGMASHLGIELDVPTIGCAKTRLVGTYEAEQLGRERGSLQPLIWEGVAVGAVLRTSDGVKPVFVSSGHRVSLPTAIQLVLDMCTSYRLPETTRAADQLVRQVMREAS